MVDYALKNDKLIGMVQTKEKNSNELYRIGCIGKITSFSKTNDKRYLINLNGISRFTLLNELNNSDNSNFIIDISKYQVISSFYL